eukprot:m.313375 g.313375  ORF g.313375 m.313375 type:complete len:885 (-) comp19663_c1_seq8:26-2680(-)
MAALASAQTAAGLREAIKQWDKGPGQAPGLAALSQSQLDTVIDLRSVADSRPLPAHLGEEPNTPSAAADASASAHGDAIDGLNADGSITATAPSSTLPGEAIESSQQFFVWFDSVEAQQEREQETAYRSYVEALKSCSAHCSDILTEIDGAVQHLADLEEQYTSVSTKTTSLHDACEQLLQEQQELAKFADCVQMHLKHFNELQTLTKKLNSPTLSVVGDQFVPLLSKVDGCVSYMRKHQTFKDAPTYLARFAHLQARGLNLIKHYIIQTLKTATQNIATQLKDSDRDTSFALFYGKFRLHAPRIKALSDEIEKRVAANAEYASLLEDCCQCYFTQRLSLLSPSTAAAVRDMQLEHKDNLAAFVRAGCAHLSRTCSNEYQLFQHFFTNPHPGLDGMLEDVCTVFYEACRPRFLGVSLDVLVELCSVLKVETMDNKGDEYAAFLNVGEQMLQDVQERLVYRSQQSVITGIKGYKPQPEHLNYPGMLSEQRKRKSEAHATGNGTLARPVIKDTLGVDPEIYAGWYPTVPSALFLLSKLYRSVDKRVCAGMSQEVTSACTTSLKEAQKLIQARAGGRHGQLFLIRHLLILREQIAPFDVEFQTTELNFDFSNVTEAVSSLYTHRHRLFTLDRTNAFLGLLLDGAPNVRESHIDSRRQVDEELKDVCQAFIRDTAKLLTAPLKSFCARVHTLPTDKQPQLKTQPWGQPDRIRAVVQEAFAVLRKQLPELAQELALYLDSPDTERILFTPIKAAVLEAFKDLSDVVDKAFADNADRDIIACPTQAQLMLMVTLDKAARPATGNGQAHVVGGAGGGGVGGVGGSLRGGNGDVDGRSGDGAVGGVDGDSVVAASNRGVAASSRESGAAAAQTTVTTSTTGSADGPVAAGGP